MGDIFDTIGGAGLQFFGKITASVSHEIKNSLAIINENAGLLEDFTFMADRGRSIDPERLRVMAEAVKRQIKRTDGIIKDMNRLAHSIDHAVTTVNLNETVQLIIALTARSAAIKNVQVDVQLPQNPVKFKTAPFFLLNLLWLCLNFSISASGDGKRVEIVVEPAQNNVRIRFQRLAGLNAAVSETFPSDQEKNLLAELEAELIVERGREEIVINLSN